MAQDLPLSVKFGTAGLGGIMGWWVVHPFNTAAVRMNLAAATNPGKPMPGFAGFMSTTIKTQGFKSLYDGVSAGTVRQIFYATSRFGLFEVFRDKLEGMDVASEKAGEVGVVKRLMAGLSSGAAAAYLSCPAEVSLVRMANDAQLPVAERRNYKGVVDVAMRISKEEGIATFWRGSSPFVQRAMVVGVCQVGTFDQGKEFYENKFGIQRGTTLNVFCAAMTSGLFYSLVTMPLESAKNRMAFQKMDPVTGEYMYKSTTQTVMKVAKAEGVLALWNGFAPYYARCGGHTTCMFVAVTWLRGLYLDRN